MKLFGHSLLVAAGLAASVVHAVEPTVYQLGDGGAVAPHLALEFGSDNNPLRATDGSQQSAYFRFQPSVDYIVQRRNNTLTFGYAGDYYQYFESYCQAQSGLVRPGDCLQGSPDFNKASYLDHTLALDGFVEVTSRLRGILDLDYNIVNQPLGTGLSSDLGVLNALTQTDYWQRTSARAQVSYGAYQARGEVQAGIRFQTQELNTERQVNLDAISDTSVAPYARVLYRVGSRTQFFAGVGYDQVREGISLNADGTTDRNFERDISRYSLGVVLDSESVTSGSLSLSAVNEDFLASREDITYVGIDADVIWRPLRISTLTFGGSRQTGSGVTSSNLSINTDIGVTWEHAWRERFSTSTALTVGWEEDIIESRDADNEISLSRGDVDRTIALRIDANYNVRRWFDVGGFINIDSRTGDGNDRDYDRTLIGLTLNGTI